MTNSYQIVGSNLLFQETTREWDFHWAKDVQPLIAKQDNGSSE